ncbi:LuxR C-terminal-related transcriptional regulator [Streptomyces acidiscabies]|uniref:LuxR C-terminal-related transcriptional regulator n=1 Tax=Streptomyces acidiscabies TaxID=42234 RepID=UPI0038F61300
MTDTRIARHLHIEESTAKTHVQSALSTLSVHTRVQAALMASVVHVTGRSGPTRVSGRPSTV